MPADFTAAKTKNVYDFLKKAADDPKFRNGLETMSRPKLRALLLKYKVKVSYLDLKKPPRTVPTPAQCRQLIKMFNLDDPYARSQYDYSSTLAPLMLVVGHAMPLVATVESEDAAAG